MDPRNLIPLCPKTFTRTEEPCPHCWDDASLFVPTDAHIVHKQECAYCCRTNEHYEGTYVCMKCFQGFCGEHVQQHVDHTGHVLYLRVKETYVKPDKPTSVEQLGVEKPPILETSMVCFACSAEVPEGGGVSEEVVVAMKAALSPQLRDQIQAQDANAFTVECKHCSIGAVTQVSESERRFGPNRPPSTSERCMDPSECEVAKNNWMCLTCGFIGCPRAEAGGKQHAITHFLMTGHPLVVKLGTVTPLGADVHCYACDEEVKPKDLWPLLRGLGVDPAQSVRTSKTLSEMMVDQSLKHDYNAVTENGRKLDPAYGPAHTGLKNFGNTCYMASVLQSLAALPSFTERFVTGPLANHQAGCTAKDPHECHSCQLEKVFKGMQSGEFAAERERPEDLERLNGITPRDFKKLWTKGHSEYSTGNQQDAEEFMSWFLLQLARRETALGDDPGLHPERALQFKQVSRVQCSSCAGCRYEETINPVLALPIPVTPFEPPMGPDGKPVEMTHEELDAHRPKTTLDACLSAFLMPNAMECRCEHCPSGSSSTVTYTTSNHLKTMPDVLAIRLRREYLCKKTYQAKKLNCEVEVPDTLDLTRLRGGVARPEETVWSVKAATAPGETTASTNNNNNTSAAPAEVDEVSLAMLLSMGIPEDGAKWALQETNNNAERAIDFFFSHPDGPPAPAATGNAAPCAPVVEVQPYQVPDGSPIYEHVGMISHVGHSALTGHYVAHCKKNGRWVMFDDEKVRFAVEPPKSLAVVHFYKRVA